MKKYYRVEYTLLVNNLRIYFISAPLKAFCKLHALIKFKRHNKHKKALKREILQIKRYKNV